MSLEISHEIASRNILTAVDAGALTQSQWHGRGNDGRDIACLLGSIDPMVNSPKDCNGKLMPMWLAELTPVLFDSISKDEIYPIARRYGDLVGRWHVLTSDQWDTILMKFLVRTIDAAIDAARPVMTGKLYWPQVESACEQCKAAIIGKKRDVAAEAARSALAAEGAVWAAEGGATVALLARRLKAPEVAAARDAAGVVRRAAWAAEGVPARAAQGVQCLSLFSFLLNEIEREILGAVG